MAVKNIHVYLLSGGMDSALVAHMGMESARADASGVEHVHAAVSVNYGQQAQWELQAAKNIAAHLGIRDHITVDARAAFAETSGDSALLAANESQDYTTRRSVYVPLRNTLMLAFAAQYAETMAFRVLEQGDDVFVASVYHGALLREERSDRTLPHSQAMSAAFNAGSSLWEDHTIPMRVETPAMFMSKLDLLHYAHRSGRWGFLGLTWSCHMSDGDWPCGVCWRCTDRTEQFEGFGMYDPWFTSREEWETWKTAGAPRQS